MTSRVVVFENVTLDGVMQAPGRPDEDRRGGFTHGGWAAPYFDPVMGEVAAEGISQGGALLLGRRTYEDFASFWPTAPEDLPFTAVMNEFQKYVVSTTLDEPLSWSNSTLLKSDAGQAVRDLKERSDQNLTVLGSGELVRTLTQNGLVDQFILLIHPLVLGTGLRLFPDGSPTTALTLVDSKPTGTGVIIATYEPAQEETG
jgi:dihydrofolate reductase